MTKRVKIIEEVKKHGGHIKFVDKFEYAGEQFEILKIDIKGNMEYIYTNGRVNVCGLDDVYELHEEILKRIKSNKFI